MLYVAVGAWCQVAHQLKRIYGDQFVTSAFDWAVTPLLSVAKVFDTAGESFGQGMFIGEPSGSIECAGYGLLYHHEFPRGADKRAIYSVEKAEAACSKLTHKHKSLITRLSLTDEPVTFVRFGGHALPAQAWPYHRDAQHVSADDMNSMVNAIARALPNLNFRVLFIRNDTCMKFTTESSAFDPRIVQATIAHPKVRVDWTGLDADWDELMASVDAGTVVASAS